jgi:hypothetical protein
MFLRYDKPKAHLDGSAVVVVVDGTPPAVVAKDFFGG